jgi:DNA topoisomerase-1
MERSSSFKLILAEKPDAAKRIADALGQKIIRYPKRGEMPVYDITRNGYRIKVMAAVGHLYTLRQSGKGWDYPVNRMEWAPRFEVEKNAGYTKAFIDKFRELSIEAESHIVATDYDVEGETIAYCILKYACREDALSQAQRMKFSTLTSRELIEAYEHPMTHIDFRMAEAGETRHKVDWLFGINISRALILAAKRVTGRYYAISAGRVQAPTLAFVANREASIRSFVPTPYWVIRAEAEIAGQIYPLKYLKDRIPTKYEAERIANECNGKEGLITKITRKETRNPPPYPFDLGSLQTEAYRLFSYTPSTTLTIAERLYLLALISYPRTNSQKIPSSLSPRLILEPLTQIPDYRLLAIELLRKEFLTPSQGIKDDPAHPPITPTGMLPPMNGLAQPEGRIYDLVVRRFMSVYGDPAVTQNTIGTVDINGSTFYLRAQRTLEKGWLKFYGNLLRREETAPPVIEEGQVLKGILVTSEEMFTKPPPRYNPSTLLRLMEQQEIGTKATRAEIIDTLSKRGYVAGDNIKITDLGSAVMSVLQKCSAEILSVEMTRRLERDMERIQSGETRGDEVTSKATDFLHPVLQRFKAAEATIGATLAEGLRESMRKSKIIGACPVCKTGELEIIRSKRTGKRFIGCTNYKTGKCVFSAPIPQSGIIQPTQKKCQSCGFPLVVIRIRGKRQWRLCINNRCDTKLRNKRKTTVEETSEGS